eukprot:gene18869-26720_t
MIKDSNEYNVFTDDYHNDDDETQSPTPSRGGHTLNRQSTATMTPASSSHDNNNTSDHSHVIHTNFSVDIENDVMPLRGSPLTRTQTSTITPKVPPPVPLVSNNSNQSFEEPLVYHNYTESFFESNCLVRSSLLPDVCVKAVEEELIHHMERLALGTPLQEQRTVKSVYEQ